MLWRLLPLPEVLKCFCSQTTVSLALLFDVVIYTRYRYCKWKVDSKSCDTGGHNSTGRVSLHINLSRYITRQSAAPSNASWKQQGFLQHTAHMWPWTSEQSIMQRCRVLCPKMFMVCPSVPGHLCTNRGLFRGGRDMTCSLRHVRNEWAISSWLNTVESKTLRKATLITRSEGLFNNEKWRRI
jgi:hypothetical protein